MVRKVKGVRQWRQLSDAIFFKIIDGGVVPENRLQKLDILTKELAKKIQSECRGQRVKLATNYDPWAEEDKFTRFSDLSRGIELQTEGPFKFDNVKLGKIKYSFDDTPPTPKSEEQIKKIKDIQIYVKGRAFGIFTDEIIEIYIL